MDLTRGFAGSTKRDVLFSDLTKQFEKADPTVVALVLEGLNRMEITKKFEWNRKDKKKCKDIVQMWRNGFLMHVSQRHFLENLTILRYFDIAIDGPGDATNYSKNVNLLNVFDSWASCRDLFIDYLTQELDPAVAVLALEGLYRMQRVMNQRPFIDEDDRRNDLQNLLRKWRNTAPLYESYDVLKGNRRLKVYLSVPDFLRGLTIFTTLKVPMVVDDYGDKKRPACFGVMEPITINGSTPIAHVTHRPEAQKIVNERRLKPSDKKNVFEGCWFGFTSSVSRYGNKRFEMTLDLLGVKGLRQGEIVSYKDEINVVLYATNDGIANFEGLVKPSKASAEEQMRSQHAFVTVSIFVAPALLDGRHFIEAKEDPVDIRHAPICVRALRSHTECYELEKRK